MNTIQLRNKVLTIKPEIIKQFNGQCYVCGFDCTPILAVHHIRHLSQGGDNDNDNLVLLCPNCHSIVHKIIREADSMSDIDIYSVSPALEQIMTWVNNNLGAEAERKLFSIARQERKTQDV